MLNSNPAKKSPSLKGYNMLAGLNRPTPNAGPRSDVIKQAIDLCAAFGNGNPALSELLQKMLGIQKKNEQVLKDATKKYTNVHAAALELQGRQNTFDEEAAAIKINFQKQDHDLQEREGKLAEIIIDNTTVETNTESKQKRRESGLSDWEARLERKQKAVDFDLGKVEAIQIENRKGSDDISNRETHLYAAIAKLRTILEDL